MCSDTRLTSSYSPHSPQLTFSSLSSIAIFFASTNVTLSHPLSNEEMTTSRSSQPKSIQQKHKAIAPSPSTLQAQLQAQQQRYVQIPGCPRVIIFCAGSRPSRHNAGRELSYTCSTS